MLESVCQGISMNRFARETTRCHRQSKAGRLLDRALQCFAVQCLAGLVLVSGVSGCGGEFSRALREGVLGGLESGIEQQIFLLVTATPSTEILGVRE